jgi:outer membrane lipoprotein SlyB
MRLSVTCILVVASLMASGCMPNVQPSSYSIGSVGQVNRTIAAVVISARTVSIDGSTGAGAGVGGVAGAVAGSSVGGGDRANALGAVGGALAGAIIGAAVERSTSGQQGMEYVVQTANGNLMTVVQGSDPRFGVGARVLVLYGSPARVIQDPRPAPPGL